MFYLTENIVKILEIGAHCLSVYSLGKKSYKTIDSDDTTPKQKTINFALRLILNVGSYGIGVYLFRNNAILSKSFAFIFSGYVLFRELNIKYDSIKYYLDLSFKTDTYKVITLLAVSYGLYYLLKHN